MVKREKWLNADAADPIVNAVGLAWLVARPGVGTLTLLGGYNVVALAFNVLAFVAYRPRSTNSNSYATSSFEEVTGQEVKGEQWLPGSEDTLPVKKPDTNQELNRQNRRVVPCNGGSAYVRCSNGVAAWWE